MHGPSVFATLVSTVLFLSSMLSSSALGQSAFEFSAPGQTTQSQAGQWQIVNDGVMGGRSKSQAAVTAEGYLRFTGRISLQNNGGFASIRSRPRPLGITNSGSIALRVKGDGRRYTFNLYTPDRRTAFSYQMQFDTRAGEWMEISLPVSGFVAHSFGRRVSGMSLNASRVQSIGILLGDKREGPFEIVVDWIRVQN